METDTFFYRLFKARPQTLFELIGEPGRQAKSYRFDSVEVKKSLRIDGLFLPRKPDLPLFFVEVQFHQKPTFYANLFAKVFCYLEENDPAQEWLAVAIFGSRSLEPKALGSYEQLLQSWRVKRIYLDEVELPDDPPPGLGIIELLLAAEDRLKKLVGRLKQRTEVELSASQEKDRMVELMQEALVRRYPQLTRQEVLAMFEFADLRDTRVYQEFVEEGIEKGIEQGIEQGVQKAKSELVHKWLAKGLSTKQIAELLEVSVPEVRRLAKTAAK